ncbi:MAG: branched-chain amino acid ABC transporter permease [Desulfobacteraceae bacterium]|nr:branched-chain amino acid ABC transporter permease [Desulfobacteraceae bacterium]
MKNFKRLTIMGLLFAAALLPFATGGYWLHIIIIAYYYALLASSWCLLAGYAGQFSFAHAALGAVGAYTSALLVLNTDMPPGFSILIGSFAAAGVGLFIGFLCLRLQGPYLALFTIAYSEIFRIALNAEYRYTGGNFGLNVPPLFARESRVLYYYTILTILVLSLFIMYKIVNSRLGLFFRAVREDEDAAATLGVNVVKYKILAFVITSFFAGLAGGFYAHYVRILTPNIIQLPQMGLIIAMVVIGGIESLAGAVAGALILQLAAEYLRDYEELRWVFFGLLLVITLRFSQNGLIYPVYKRLTKKSENSHAEGE